MSPESCVISTTPSTSPVFHISAHNIMKDYTVTNQTQSYSGITKNSPLTIMFLIIAD